MNNSIIRETTKNANVLPRFMTIKETAMTGILPECCLRRMARKGELPAIKTGNKTLINFDRLVDLLNNLDGQIVQKDA